MAHGVESLNTIWGSKNTHKNLEGFKQSILVESVELMQGPRKLFFIEPGS